MYTCVCFLGRTSFLTLSTLRHQQSTQQFPDLRFGTWKPTRAGRLRHPCGSGALVGAAPRSWLDESLLREVRGQGSQTGGCQAPGGTPRRCFWNRTGWVSNDFKAMICGCVRFPRWKRTSSLKPSPQIFRQKATWGSGQTGPIDTPDNHDRPKSCFTHLHPV